MIIPPLPAQLTDSYSALISREVNWGDMDAANHVNNTIYIRWSESARIAFWEAAELPMIPQSGPVLSKVSAKYIFPVSFPDRVWMGTRMNSVDGEAFTFESLIVSERHQRVACLVTSTGVMFDYLKQQKLPILPNMQEAFSRAGQVFLGKPFPQAW
ncbi:MAG: thioesterase family protein [Bacteroidia bacterium]|nr:thioesterase family protein [Bacteroidia bacterium]